MLSGMFAAKIASGPPPGGFPVMASRAFNFDNSYATSLVGTMPSGVTAGDGLVGLLATVGSAAVTTPSGWTLVDSWPDSNYSGYRMYLYRRLADGSEGSTVTAACPDGERYGFLVMRFTNIDTSGFFDYNRQLYAGTSWTQAALSPTWGALDTLWLNLVVSYDTMTPSSYPLPDNQDKYGTTTGRINMAICSKEENTATLASGSGTWPSYNGGTTVTVAIKPP